MPRLLKRWYVWLGLVLVLGLSGSVALIWSSQGRITQKNFDRIQEGMSVAEVLHLLGPPKSGIGNSAAKADEGITIVGGWENGPNWVRIHFVQGKVWRKQCRFASARETLQYYLRSYYRP
jgi:hypothetical protein